MRLLCTVAWPAAQSVQHRSVQSRFVAGWQIWTEPGGLAWADPGPDFDCLGRALADCASTLSPRGEPPTLSTYSIDGLLRALAERPSDELAHGNLWVFTLNGDQVETRMDIDDPTSEPVDSIAVDQLVAGLTDLRDEVVRQLANGHQLDDRNWSQKNPGP